MAIRFEVLETDPRLKDKRRLKAYLLYLVGKYLEGVRKVDLQYVFCTDDYLLEINRKFLKHDTYTDIVTFDLSETEEVLSGEIYISVDRVSDNAQKFKVSYNQELHRVIFHGLLHLCGFLDKKPEDKEEMRRQEDWCIRHYGV